MADGNTETATSTPSSDAQSSGSEFALPTGVKDDEIWQKHFGPKGETPKETGSTRSRTESTRSRTEPSRADREKSTSGSRASESRGKDTSTRSDESTKPSRDKPSDKEASKPKESKSSKETDSDSSKAPTKSSDSTKERSDKKSKPGSDDAEDTDADKPEEAEVSARARELYEESKKAQDPKEARRLFKRAVKEAFGELPPELDDSRYYAVRKERQAAQAALDEKQKQNEGRIREAAEKLRPAIAVMQMLEKGGVAERLTVPLVEKAIHVLKALRSLEDGDYTQLAEVVARASGCDHDEAMRRFVNRVKVSPEGRAARAAAQQAEERAARAEARLAELEKRLTAGDEARTKEKTEAEKQAALQARHAQYLEDLALELEGHPVLKLPRGAERVKAYILKTADRRLKAAKYTPQQAADRIVAYERKRAREAATLDTDGEEADERTETRPRAQTRARSETRDNGVVSESAEASLDRIMRRHNWGR